ncbi:MAG: helix-turn-helix domain-containing protein, partial [Gordonibacter sp.]|uniref:helix-turn-helix domain-containing protein n=1 Tax=Gordonibacter sp. TaxID=1968902 RepID=UPI002FCA539A
CTTQSVLSDGIVTARELAETLRISTGFVYKMARENRIPVIRIGRAVRFSVGDVERELAKYSRWR